KTFLLHFPLAPQADGTNSYLGVNGDQALRLTSLTPGASFKVVDEKPAGGTDQASYYHYRLEETTTGQAQNYLINVLDARDASAANVTATMTENATSWTIQLTHPTKGTSVIVLNKGMTSSGGTFGYSPTGTPTSSTPLLNRVEGISVSPNGVVW